MGGSAYRCICLHLFRSKAELWLFGNFSFCLSVEFFLQVIQTFLIVCLTHLIYIFHVLLSQRIKDCSQFVFVQLLLHTQQSGVAVYLTGNNIKLTAR